MSWARYDGGVTDYLEVLDADRSLFDAQLQASVIRRLEMVSIITLYRALGGGWLPAQTQIEVVEEPDESSDPEVVEATDQEPAQ